MLPGFGGPMGRHAAPRGPWFTPLLWVLPVATVLFLVLFLRHVPCVQVDAANPINAYIRACYSDIQVTYLSQGLGDGASPLTAETLAFPPLIAALILIVNRIVFAVFGLERATDGDLQPAIDASVAFFGVTVVLLFIAFLVLAFAFTRLGRDDRAVLGDRATRQGAGCSRHWPDLAKLLRGGNFGFSGDGDGSCGTVVRQIAQSGPREELQT